LAEKHHWIHPHFEVGLFVEDTRALPVQSTMGVNDKVVEKTCASRISRLAKGGLFFHQSTAATVSIL
jgi:hypothetical protein